MANESLDKLRKRVKDLEERKRLEAKLRELQKKGKPERKGKKIASGFFNAMNRAASKIEL